MKSVVLSPFRLHKDSCLIPNYSLSDSQKIPCADVKLFKVSSSNDSVITSFLSNAGNNWSYVCVQASNKFAIIYKYIFFLYFTIWEASLICNYVWKINACDPIKIVSQSLYFSKSFLSAVYAFL